MKTLAILAALAMIGLCVVLVSQEPATHDMDELMREHPSIMEEVRDLQQYRWAQYAATDR